MTEEEISVQEQYEEILATGDEAVISDFLNQQNISDVAELVEENEDHELEIFLRLSLRRAVS
ncbi:MAG: magnesium transporter, partial [Bacteroidota bacterium]|nr:magnesium transporter [Bacteroidota bacterium]